MIDFECPECGAVMEVSDQKAGARVRCIGCGDKIKVPKLRRQQAAAPMFAFDKLTAPEYLLYGSVMLCVPCLGLIGVAVAQAFWQEEQPTKAYQLTLLGCIIACIQAVVFCVLCV